MVPWSWGRAHVSEKSSCKRKEPRTAICQEVVGAKAVEGRDRRGAESSHRRGFGRDVGLGRAGPPGPQLSPGPWNLAVSVQTKYVLSSPLPLTLISPRHSQE